METIFITGLLLFVNFILSFVAGGVASSKGRSVFGYFFLSIFFSFLVAILVLVALPAKKNVYELRECPYCAEEIKREALVCKHCTREVEPLESIQPPFFSGNWLTKPIRRGAVPTVIGSILLLMWLSASNSPDLDPGNRFWTLITYLAILGFGIYRLNKKDSKSESKPKGAPGEY